MEAERLFLTTGTDAIYRNFSTPQKERIEKLTVDEARDMAEEGQFPPGSMGPKVEAAINFVDAGGREAVICSPPHLVDAFGGHAGTRIF
jgi:carbamate kinase